MLNLFLYLLLIGGFLLGLVLGLTLLLFPVRIMRWAEREFHDTSEWVLQSRIYKYFGIKITSPKIYIWWSRIIGALLATLSGAALVGLISFWF